MDSPFHEDKIEYLVCARLSRYGVIYTAKNPEQAATKWTKTKEGKKYITQNGQDAVISVYQLGPRHIFNPVLETSITGLQQANRI